MKQFSEQDRYEVIAPLGAGSEASVWLAKEVATGRQVALKYFSTQPGVSAFRELSNARQEPHPNIVDMLDFVYLASGDSFLVFEYVAGGTLRDVLNEQGKFDHQAALKIVRDLIAALAEIHREGSIHCDIKPENILRATNETTSEVTYKLTDFGVAQKLNRSIAKSDLVGSPAYMAPERFRDQVFSSSDLYSVGVIFFELLTGERPFNGSAEQVARAHLSQPIPPIENIPSEVESFLHNLMEKDPQQRIQTGEVALRTIDILINQPGARKTEPVARRKPDSTWQPMLWNDGITSRIRGRYSVPLTDAEPRLIGRDDQLKLALDFGTHWEFFEGITGNSLGSIVSKSGSVQQFAPPGDLVYSVQQKVMLWRSDHSTPSELISFTPKVKAAALSPDKKRVAWSNHKSCEIVDLASSQSVSIKNVSLHSTPSLTWLDSHNLVLSQGPMNPELKVINPQGDAVAEIGLPGPILKAAPDHLSPMWITLDHNDRETLTVVACEAGRNWHQWRIPGNYRALELSPNGLLFLDEDGLLSKWSFREQGRPITRLASQAEGMSISPSQRFGITWRRSRGQIAITSYEFTQKAQTR
ncbi:MAG: hypothetical protein SynsKO_36130 [Synoicihabitans sp.]